MNPTQGRDTMTHARLSRVRRLAAAVLTATALTVASPANADLDPADEVHSLQHVRATGSVHSGDGVLERGCQTHPYRYRVRPRGSEWSLEVFLINPAGKRLATGYEWKGKDPRRGRGRFEFCSQTTRPGRYKVRSRLTWEDGRYHEKWLEPRTIRLHR
jgi:hypothetical protein